MVWLRLHIELYMLLSALTMCLLNKDILDFSWVFVNGAQHFNGEQ